MSIGSLVSSGNTFVLTVTGATEIEIMTVGDGKGNLDTLSTPAGWTLERTYLYSSSFGSGYRCYLYKYTGNGDFTLSGLQGTSSYALWLMWATNGTATFTQE